MSERSYELGNLLKIKRGSIQPEQVGMSRGARRRTPGLQREEVAQLAGTGLTWYIWLEQGWDIQVSDQVLKSLSQVLRLNREETRHLFALAGRGNADYPEEQSITPAIKNLMDSVVDIPVYMGAAYSLGIQTSGLCGRVPY